MPLLCGLRHSWQPQWHVISPQQQPPWSDWGLRGLQTHCPLRPRPSTAFSIALDHSSCTLGLYLWYLVRHLTGLAWHQDHGVQGSSQMWRTGKQSPQMPWNNWGCVHIYWGLAASLRPSRILSLIEQHKSWSLPLEKPHEAFAEMNLALTCRILSGKGLLWAAEARRVLSPPLQSRLSLSHTHTHAYMPFRWGPTSIVELTTPVPSVVLLE